MSLKKAESRDKKHQKRSKMRVSGKSVFLIQEIQIKKSDKIKKEKETDS